MYQSRQVGNRFIIVYFSDDASIDMWRRKVVAILVRMGFVHEHVGAQGGA